MNMYVFISDYVCLAAELSPLSMDMKRCDKEKEFMAEIQDQLTDN